MPQLPPDPPANYPVPLETNPVSYWYEGRCPQTGRWFRLPRTVDAEACARSLMQALAQDERYHREGKMYGVLIALTATGEQCILKAFSGLLNGEREVEGWVPMIPGHASIALVEAIALSQLEAMKQRLIELDALPARSQLAQLQQRCAAELQQLAIDHQQRQHQRQHQRQTYQRTLMGDALQAALEQLNRQSQQDGLQRRKLKQQQQAQLHPLAAEVAAADAQMRVLKQERKQLSRQLQAQLHDAYRLTNFAGQSYTLSQLLPAMPTGTGECCAPKLLHYAATHGLRPIALAEFWWGPAQADKIPGHFYGACRDRCQPLMGFLLSGLTTLEAAPTVDQPCPIVYEDDRLLVVDKPAGLLSVPGRYRDRQDSVLTRVQMIYPTLWAVHRLDQDTSGILLLAKDRETYRALSHQFQQRQVQKIYEALVVGQVRVASGLIDLPLGPDPDDRPRQTVDWQQGKPSQTQFRVINQHGDRPRVELIPVTGRTHQLRVHSAHPQGLNTPILGDRWYGQTPAPRLHLHAKTLQIQHPQDGRSLRLNAPVPF